MRIAAFCLVFLGVLSARAAADLVTYDYVGSEFTTHVNGFFPTQDRFTGTIVVDSDKLGGKVSNRLFGTSAIPEFSFTDGDRTFNEGNVGSANFSIETDANGDIINWALSFGESVYRFRIANFFWYFPAHDESFINVGFGLYASTTVPGTWTRRNPPSPPSVAEPPAALLFAAGLGILAWRLVSKRGPFRLRSGA